MADEAKWYVVHTYSGYENTVKATIRSTWKTAALHDSDPRDHASPWKPSPRSPTTGPKTVERKVFPRLCAGEDGDDRRSPGTWCATSAASPALWAPATRPSPPLSERTSPPWAWRARIVVGYEVGDTVKITDGALESFLGTVEGSTWTQQRSGGGLHVWTGDPVELELDQVEPVSLTHRNTIPCRTWEDGTVRI